MFKEPGWHLLHGKNVIHEPCLDGTLRHAPMLGCLRRLGEGQAAVVPDRAKPCGAIMADARKEYPDGLVASIRRERAEEGIDGSARSARLDDLEYAVLDSQRGSRTDHIHVIGLGARSIFGLHDREPAVPREKLREQAGALWIEMLDDHEGKPTAGGYPREEPLERVEAACRGA
jgi:hypothetical protein